MQDSAIENNRADFLLQGIWRQQGWRQQASPSHWVSPLLRHQQSQFDLNNHVLISGMTMILIILIHTVLQFTR